MTAFQAQPWIESFNPREIEVLRLISNGLSNREIAQELYLSVETIKWYNRQMFMKLGVKNRIQAVNKAAELDLLGSKYNFQPQEKIPLAGNLPAQLTSYVGREKETDEIKALLKDYRLVMLTGAGGSGKTRFALKVGEELRDTYPDGVWLVELANVREPSLVLRSIANALNITERTDAPLDDVLKRYLSRRHLLLLIDNLEHLLECAPLIGELLAAAPRLSVLGTSRERLHIYGEQEYPVRPLNLPNPRSIKKREDLKKVESVALFMRRARAVHPTISLDDEALEDLARICVRLDGLPLAIELCAPMVKMYPLKVIADRIEKSLDAIPSGPRDLPARQQTLRSTIQWSFDLLDESEKRLFIRLAIFNGGSTLQAIEAICGEGIPGNIGNTLSALVNKNLVLARERQDGEIHFSLLETIRQFAHDKLLALGEVEELADCHADYFMELAKQSSVELRGPSQIVWTHRLIVMQENFRVALEWIIEKRETDTALQFTRDLFEFWLRHANFEEGQWWLQRVMALPNARQFQELYTEALKNLSWITWLQGKTEKAKNMAEQVLQLARSLPNKLNTAEALLNLGLMLISQKNDLARGQAYIEESKTLCEEIHNEWELARALMHLAIVNARKNEYNTACSLYSKSFNLYKKLGDIHFQGVVKRLIGNLEVKRDNLRAGMKAYREALVIAQSVKSDLQISYNIWELARAAKARENHIRALQLYLASKRILDDIGAWWSGDEPELEEELATARAVLGEAEFHSAMEAGQHMTMEEAIEYALSDDAA